MKIYIAAKYRRRFELRAVADTLRAVGHEITSQWLDNGEEEAGGPEAAAQMDVEDVLRADALLFIGEPQGSSNTGGGRWFELGLAYASHKRCLILLAPPTESFDSAIGTVPRGHETVFTALPQFEIYLSLEEVLKEL